MAQPSAPPVPGRIMSVDVLRGFDMFWITGGKEVLFGLFAVLSLPLPMWFERHLEHVEWEGFVAWDLIMPLFLFIVGAAMPFAFKRRAESGQGGAALYFKIIRRVIILWVLGMIAQGNLLQVLGTAVQGDFNPAKLHFYSNTLQAIASGYLVASLVMLNVGIAGQLVATAALLLGFWALMALVPFPGHAAGVLEPHANLARYVDVALLGRFRDGSTYTWILSSMGFSASVLLGVQAGHTLLSSKTPFVKLLMLIAAGLGCLGLGWAWGLWFPIIKHIWTSTMVLWAAGWSFLLLAALYLVVDIIGWQKWAFLFVVIGTNAILAYMGAPFLEMGLEYLFELAGPMGPFTEYVCGLLSFGLMWTALYLLYRKKWFLRI
jgi:predicted acyltransferase